MTVSGQPADQPGVRPVVPSSGAAPIGSSPTRSILVALGIVAGLVVLAVIVILALGGGGVREYPAGSPEATVQAYVRAVDSSDLAAAYAQLSARLKGTMTQAAYADRSVMYGYGGGDGSSRVVRIDRTDVRDDRATVVVSVEQYYTGGGLTPNRSTNHATLQLVREDSAWKLDQLYFGPDLMPDMP